MTANRRTKLVTSPTPGGHRGAGATRLRLGCPEIHGTCGGHVSFFWSPEVARFADRGMSEAGSARRGG